MVLDDHRRFGRAALACHVTQPALSNALHALEDGLSIPTGKRGRNQAGYTVESERMDNHAPALRALPQCTEHCLLLRRSQAGTGPAPCAPPRPLPGAMVHVVVTENLVDEAFMAERGDTTSSNDCRESVARASNSRDAPDVALVVPAADLRAAARLYAAAMMAMERAWVQDRSLNETARYAHGFLPGSSFIEMDGSFTHAERRISRVRKVMPPEAGCADWELTQLLANALGYPMKYSHPQEIMDEIAAPTPTFRASASRPSTAWAACCCAKARTLADADGAAATAPAGSSLRQ